MNFYDGTLLANAAAAARRKHYEVGKLSSVIWKRQGHANGWPCVCLLYDSDAAVRRNLLSFRRMLIFGRRLVSSGRILLRLRIVVNSSNGVFRFFDACFFLRAQRTISTTSAASSKTSRTTTLMAL